MAEIDSSAGFGAERAAPARCEPLDRFPAVERDLSVVCDAHRSRGGPPGLIRKARRCSPARRRVSSTATPAVACPPGKVSLTVGLRFQDRLAHPDRRRGAGRGRQRGGRASGRGRRDPGRVRRQWRTASICSSRRSARRPSCVKRLQAREQGARRRSSGEAQARAPASGAATSSAAEKQAGASEPEPTPRSWKRSRTAKSSGPSRGARTRSRSGWRRLVEVLDRRSTEHGPPRPESSGGVGVYNPQTPAMADKPDLVHVEIFGQTYAVRGGADPGLRREAGGPRGRPDARGQPRERRGRLRAGGRAGRAQHRRRSLPPARPGRATPATATRLAPRPS